SYFFYSRQTEERGEDMRQRSSGPGSNPRRPRRGLRPPNVFDIISDFSADCRAAKLADIVFIVDESGSITVENFQLVRSFLYSIISGLEINPNRVRVGIVLYNEQPTAQVYLNTFKQKTELLNFIKILPYRGGGTSTGAALNFTQENVFITETGSRKDKGVEQVAVVITDGESQDNVSQAAAELRRAGVTIYSVGVQNANEDELRQIASHPPQKHVFIVDSFARLKSLEEYLQKTLYGKLTEIMNYFQIFYFENPKPDFTGYLRVKIEPTCSRMSNKTTSEYSEPSLHHGSPFTVSLLHRSCIVFCILIG
uniref:VWFA domain-containing protein n=1 Tax=Xiphophorus couchianus TaxID=32473 RepID=A0A3B5MVE2_9TELE